MKKHIILTCLSIIFLSYTSCSEKDEVERLTIEPTIVKADLMTSMPGELLALEDTILDEMESWINNLKGAVGDTRIKFEFDNDDNRNYRLTIKIDNISLININIGVK